MNNMLKVLGAVIFVWVLASGLLTCLFQLLHEAYNILVR